MNRLERPYLFTQASFSAYNRIVDNSLPKKLTTTANSMSIEQTYKKSRRVPDTFRALRHRNYRLWFFGQGISLIGTWMQTMAQQVLVYRITGSATALGVINFISLIPLIPFSLWGGSIADRFSKRSIILWMQVAMLIQAMILAVLTWSGTVQLWHVYLLSFFLSTASSIDLPARQAFTVDMVEGKEDLTNAIGLNSAMFNTARALGPALAGLIVAATGEGNAFFLNALTFIPVMISLLMMRNLPNSSHAVQKGTRTSDHLKEGIRFVVSQRTILVLTSLIAISAFLSMPYNTLMPVFATQVLGDSAKPVIQYVCEGSHALFNCQAPEALPLGILLACMGFGAVLGALFVASLPAKAPRGMMLTIGNLSFPALLLFFAFSKSFIFSLAMMVLVGISFVWQNALANTLLQIYTPDELRGRVMSLYTLVFAGMMRLGGLQAGLVSDWLTAPISVGIGAVISLIYGAYVAIRYPKVRQLS